MAFQHQQQLVAQEQRCLEASKQMVFDVFGNAIGMLEELERRETSSQILPQSDIDLPNMITNDRHDVIEILKLQLLGLKYQLKSCRSEIRRNVRKDLRSKANEWRLARQGLNLPVSEPYVDCLLDILNNRTLVFPECDEIDETTGFSDSDTQMLLNATHKTAELDDSFKNDPNKKASLPKIRSSVNEGTTLSREPEILEDVINTDVKDDESTTLSRESEILEDIINNDVKDDESTTLSREPEILEDIINNDVKDDESNSWPKCTVEIDDTVKLKNGNVTYPYLNILTYWMIFWSLFNVCGLQITYIWQFTYAIVNNTMEALSTGSDTCFEIILLTEKINLVTSQMIFLWSYVGTIIAVVITACFCLINYRFILIIFPASLLTYLTPFIDDSSEFFYIVNGCIQGLCQVIPWAICPLTLYCICLGIAFPAVSSLLANAVKKNGKPQILGWCYFGIPTGISVSIFVNHLSSGFFPLFSKNSPHFVFGGMSILWSSLLLLLIVYSRGKDTLLGKHFQLPNSLKVHPLVYSYRKTDLFLVGYYLAFNFGLYTVLLLIPVQMQNGIWEQTNKAFAYCICIMILSAMAVIYFILSATGREVCPIRRCTQLFSETLGLVSQAVIFVVIFVYLKLETCAQSFVVFSLLLGCIVCGGIGIQSFFKHHLDIGAEKLGIYSAIASIPVILLAACVSNDSMILVLGKNLENMLIISAGLDIVAVLLFRLHLRSVDQLARTNDT